MAALFAFAAAPLSAHAQDSSAPPAPTRRRPPIAITDTARARELFVSKDPKDLAGCGSQCAVQIAAKHRTDSIYAAKAP